MTCTVTKRLYTLNLPPTPSLTTTRLGAVWPATKFRFEALGLGAPVGHAVTKLDAVGSVAVRLRTTAETPVDGTEERRVGETSICDRWWKGDPDWRVSRMRAGVRPE